MDAAKPPPGPLFALALGSIAFVGPLAVHLFMPVIPAVKEAFKVSDAVAQLTFSVALFVMAFATLVYGSLADRYGRRPVLLSGLCLFLLGSVISAASATALTLVLGRLVQAIGAGCGMTLVRAIARDAYGADRLVKALAYLTMFYTLGPMVAPAIGGVLIDTLGWRSVFGFAVVVGCVITLAAYSALYETHTRRQAGAGIVGMLRTYAALFAHLRFSAFVLQSGFNSGTFMAVATAGASLMSELLHRPSAEYGLYFMFFPAGFFSGNLVASRVGNRASVETMVLAGSLLNMVAMAAQAGVLLSGVVTPLAIFLPGFFMTMGQGVSLPFGQAGAMATMPQAAGTAAGVGVFVQFFVGAAFAQLYGLIADGTPGPMLVTAALSAGLGLVSGAAPMALRLRKEPV